MEWGTILSQPVTQLGGLIGVALLLQRSGIDIGKIIREALGLSESHEADAQLRNDFQILLSQMQELSQYANHDTTEKLLSIGDDIKALQNNMIDHVRQHDKTNYLLEDIKNNGIKCR